MNRDLQRISVAIRVVGPIVQVCPPDPAKVAALRLADPAWYARLDEARGLVTHEEANAIIRDVHVARGLRRARSRTEASWRR